MALNYTLKTAPVMDGSTQVGTVHGLSLNEITELVLINKDAANSIYNELSGVEAEEISEMDFLRLGYQMVSEIPKFVAQVIAAASDAYDDHVEDDGKPSPLEVILSMPAGLQISFLEKIAELTFVSTSPKKLMALAFKNAQERNRSQKA